MASKLKPKPRSISDRWEEGYPRPLPRPGINQIGTAALLAATEKLELTPEADIHKHQPEENKLTVYFINQEVATLLPFTPEGVRDLFQLDGLECVSLPKEIIELAELLETSQLIQLDKVRASVACPANSLMSKLLQKLAEPIKMDSQWILIEYTTMQDEKAITLVRSQQDAWEKIIRLSRDGKVRIRSLPEVAIVMINSAIYKAQEIMARSQNDAN